MPNQTKPCSKLLKPSISFGILHRRNYFLATKSIRILSEYILFYKFRHLYYHLLDFTLASSENKSYSDKISIDYDVFRNRYDVM